MNLLNPYKNPPESPFIVFQEWHRKAKEVEGIMANTMTLSTVNYLGQPSIRMMMLNMIHNQSFVFFTNMESRKAAEILDNPNVALCFYWPNCKRQVRVEGTAFKVSSELADKVFDERPLEHKLNILISPQSRLMENISDLEQKTAELSAQMDESNIKRPPNWHGFAITPSRMEFWQEQPFWMHERLVYTDYQGEWSFSRLYP
jgi:pyridoxamine 5'-phosphate oxidase